MAPSDDERPQRAEGVVQAGAEVVAPDAGVGRVVEDAEVGTARLQALRMGQPIGPRCSTWGSGLPVAIRLRRYQ